MTAEARPGPRFACQPEAPYDRLATLPRGTWLPGIVTSVGTVGARLDAVRRWLDALGRGELPSPDADFGDAAACQALRAIVGELGLPALCRLTPALCEQVVRTVLWHLDRIVDHQPRQCRAQAIDTVAAEFREAWRVETAGLEDELRLLAGLGDFDDLRWDSLRGHLGSRPWAEARRAADRLARLPALAALIRRLGRAERAPSALPAPAHTPEAGSRARVPVRAVQTRLPDAPGAIVGVRGSAHIERMLASEAAMLRHEVLKKLWRARHAEGRLLSWQTEAVLVDWRCDPSAPGQAAVAPELPQPLERGPIVLCLDTSGSMRGAPEHVAKAVVIAALRAAHEAGRGCRLVAFGGPGEIVERDLQRGAAGLQALLDLMGQAFDGGTDIQTPVERAIAGVRDARWRSADLLLVSDGEFGCVPQTLEQLDAARAELGLRVQGILVGDRETLGMLEVCDHIHWVRDWRRFAGGEAGADLPAFSPVHSKSLTALYFPNALSARAARHQANGGEIR